MEEGYFMEQLELFEELVRENNIWDAHMVIKNIYNKDISNQDIFIRYFDFACMIASWNIEITTRKYFISEAETALVFFSENAPINKEILMCIKSYRNKMMEISNLISKIEKEETDKYQKKTFDNNNVLLSDLIELKSRLFYSKNQKEFDDHLMKINEKENDLVKEALDMEQKNLYDKLTKEYSVIISDKMTELNALNNKQYNKDAVKEFKFVFDEFKNNEDKYKNSQSRLFSLVYNRLFSYDLAKLFNETLIYYNHVYSFIFSKLDDDGKFRLTQISIDTEKIKR